MQVLALCPKVSDILAGCSSDVHPLAVAQLASVSQYRLTLSQNDFDPQFLCVPLHSRCTYFCYRMLRLMSMKIHIFLIVWNRFVLALARSLVCLGATGESTTLIQISRTDQSEKKTFFIFKRFDDYTCTVKVP